MKKKNSIKQKGFTVVELVIVLVVIAVLSAIIIKTYGGIQVKNANATRKGDLQLVQDKLEAFYSNNGYYPSLTDINSPSWRHKNMPSLNPADMIDPSSKLTTSNAQLAPAPETKMYSYQVTDSNGKSCESDDTNCAKYKLTAIYQGTYDGRKEDVLKNLD